MIASWAQFKKKNDPAVKGHQGEFFRAPNADRVLCAATTSITALWFRGRMTLLGDVDICGREVSRCQQFACKLFSKIKVFGEREGGGAGNTLTVAGLVSPCTRFKSIGSDFQNWKYWGEKDGKAFRERCHRASSQTQGSCRHRGYTGSLNDSSLILLLKLS